MITEVIFWKRTRGYFTPSLFHLCAVPSHYFKIHFPKSIHRDGSLIYAIRLHHILVRQAHSLWRKFAFPRKQIYAFFWRQFANVKPYYVKKGSRDNRCNLLPPLEEQHYSTKLLFMPGRHARSFVDFEIDLRSFVGFKGVEDNGIVL